ncbi:MAG: NAD(P)H-hydrate dehydratase [Candidatus Methylacidiphilales bacterium]
MNILDPHAMRAWEDQTLCSGVTVETLMQVAVDGMFVSLSEQFPPMKCLVLAGKGNNGSDALWLASRLRAAGWNVEVWLSHPRDADTMFHHAIQDEVGRAVVWPDVPEGAMEGSDQVIVIDGLLGLGAKGAPREPYASILRWVESQVRPFDLRVAVDVPSGLDGDTGEAYDPCFKADLTLALGAVKIGCVRGDGPMQCGRLRMLPLPLSGSGPKAGRDFFTLEEARALCRHREVDTHKHRQGVVGIRAGSMGMAGAAVLASRAAIRSGAGLVRLAVDPELMPLLATATPEVMVQALGRDGELGSLLTDCDALLIGPGIGLGKGAEHSVLQMVEQSRCPLVWDADALTLMARLGLSFSGISERSVVTPHAGEFRRLFPEGNGNRESDAGQFAALNPGLTLCLKGPNTLVTLVAAHGQNISYNGSGNPGLATAGSGDVLAGLLAGLLATGMNTWDAARLSVFWHGLAGDLAARRVGETSMIAGDIVDDLGSARLLICRP